MTNEIQRNDLPPVGSRVELQEDVERYPHFIAETGRTGIVVDIGDPDIYAVRMDVLLPGAEEWNNEVQWSLRDDDDPTFDLRVVDHQDDEVPGMSAALINQLVESFRAILTDQDGTLNGIDLTQSEDRNHWWLSTGVTDNEGVDRTFRMEFNSHGVVTDTYESN